MEHTELTFPKKIIFKSEAMWVRRWERSFASSHATLLRRVGPSFLLSVRQQPADISGIK